MKPSDLPAAEPFVATPSDAAAHVRSRLQIGFELTLVFDSGIDGRGPGPPVRPLPTQRGDQGPTRHLN